MNPQRRIVALTWGTGIAGLLASWITFFLVRDYLPSPVASQWTNSATPTSAQSHWAFLSVISFLFVVQFLVLLFTRATSHKKAQSINVGGMNARQVGAFSAGWTVFCYGMYLLMIYVNWDLNHWSEARLSWVGLALVLGAGLGAGFIGWLLAPKSQPEALEPEPPLTDVSATARVTWSGSIWVPILTWSLVLVSLSSVIAIYVSMGVSPEANITVALTLPLMVLALLLTGPVSVSIGRSGVVVRFGILGWPRWTIPLDDIELAGAEERSPGDVGGWGLRFYGGGKAVMLRGGECLIIQRRHGRSEVTISVDDAKTAAATINSLRQTA